MKKINITLLIILSIALASLSTAQPTEVSAQECFVRSQGTSTPANCPDQDVDGNDLDPTRCYFAAGSSQGVSGFSEASCETGNTDTGTATGGVGAEGTSRDDLAGDSDKNCEVDVGEALSSENCGIIELAVNVINFLSAVAGIAIVASIMISGYQYMTAQDDPGKVQKSRARIVQTLIALLLFVFMYALLNFLIPGGLGLVPPPTP